MHRSTISVVVTLAIGFMLRGLATDVSLMAQGGNTPKPMQGELGTWRLNLSKSKWDPGPPPQSATISTRELTAEGVKVTNKGRDWEGKAFETVSIQIYDGKDRPLVGNADADTIARTRLNDFTVESQYKKGGKVVQLLTFELSKDGKVLTATNKSTDPRRRLNNVTIWEKQ